MVQSLAGRPVEWSAIEDIEPIDIRTFSTEQEMDLMEYLAITEI